MLNGTRKRYNIKGTFSIVIIFYILLYYIKLGVATLNTISGESFLA